MTFIALASLALLLSILNSITILSPSLSPSPSGSQPSPLEQSRSKPRRISILLPLRNEAKNVDTLIESIAKQIAPSGSLHQWEVIALDDDSSDETLQLLLDAQSRFDLLKVIRSDGPFEKWLGKPAAQERLFRAASGEFLVYVDADVRLEPEAIVRSIDLMVQRDWDFISPYPRQIAETFIERMIQPLLQWSWFASVPLRLAERLRIPSMAVANGQLFIVRRDALEVVGGFTLVKTEILEDLELARALWRVGKKGSVVDGSAIAQCRMYQGGQELIDGYSKSLWRAFGSPLGALFAAFLLLATSWGPLLMALTGNPWGWIAYFFVSLSRLIAALRTRSFWQGFLLHPVSVVILLYILLRSFHLKSQGQLSWRDRKIEL